MTWPWLLPCSATPLQLTSRASSTAPAFFARASDAASTNPTTVSAPWRHSKRMLAGSPAASRSASMPPSSGTLRRLVMARGGSASSRGALNVRWISAVVMSAAPVRLFRRSSASLSWASCAGFQMPPRRRRGGMLRPGNRSVSRAIDAIRRVGCPLSRPGLFVQVRVGTRTGGPLRSGTPEARIPAPFEA